MNALMASPKWFFSLVVLTLVLSFSLPSCSSVEGDHGIDSAAPPLFPLNPQQLVPLLISDKDLMAIIDLRLVPSSLRFLHRVPCRPRKSIEGIRMEILLSDSQYEAEPLLTCYDSGYEKKVSQNWTLHIFVSVHTS
ncbi:hypothetical protein ACFX1T_009906 [Malus domestica]